LSGEKKNLKNVYGKIRSLEKNWGTQKKKFSGGCVVLGGGGFCFVLLFFWGGGGGEWRSACSVARNRNIYKMFMGKSEVWRLVGKSKNIRKGKIEMNVK